MQTRTEHDQLGSRDIPGNAYWGIHTSRAMDNFPVTGEPIGGNTDLIWALGTVKLAAAKANRDAGVLDERRFAAISTACEEVRGGKFNHAFVVDVIQGGAGTSTNMNANEVLANRALELLGRAKGDYDHLHPIEHVNLSQSTNDVYPTAARLACIRSAQTLLRSMAELRTAFAAKSKEFGGILKMGRTQLQEAVPMTLGQEFGAYARMVAEDESLLRAATELLHEVSLGGTAIGTRLNASPGYSAVVIGHLSELAEMPLTESPDLVEANQDVGAFVHLSGVLKRAAVKLSKICNDLRLLSSGPRSGFNEINLPAVQAGSSIMPGKINPVIPEVVNQVAFEVIGNDLAITMSAEAGQLQLNAFEPLIIHSLARSLRHLNSACLTLSRNCVDGITANPEQLRGSVENSIGLVTALNPYLGYIETTRLAREAVESGRSVPELVLARALMTPEALAAVLRPEFLAGINLPAGADDLRVRGETDARDGTDFAQGAFRS